MPTVYIQLSDLGDLSKHIKCAKLHIIVDESRKIKRKKIKQYFIIPNNPENPETIPRKSHPVPKPRFLDSSRPDPDRSQTVHPAGL
jgi:hypothetical protein